MATYVVFFALGDFERAVRKVGPVENGVVVKRGDLGQASLALEMSTALLPWYNAWLSTDYPLPKLDHIAGPGRSEFFGAMENWGAIFYFEYALLFDPAISTIADKQRIFQVVSHEMAHQWFGDLVTMGWWDDVWLNESFATWMQHKAAEAFHPEWSRRCPPPAPATGRWRMIPLSAPTRSCVKSPAPTKFLKPSTR